MTKKKQNNYPKANKRKRKYRQRNKRKNKKEALKSSPCMSCGTPAVFVDEIKFSQETVEYYSCGNCGKFTRKVT